MGDRPVWHYLKGKRLILLGLSSMVFEATMVNLGRSAYMDTSKKMVKGSG
jgi:hypothetical protein